MGIGYISTHAIHNRTKESTPVKVTEVDIASLYGSRTIEYCIPTKAVRDLVTIISHPIITHLSSSEMDNGHRVEAEVCYEYTDPQTGERHFLRVPEESEQ